MTTLVTSITKLELDEFGRTVLSDDLLEAVEDMVDFPTAGGANSACNNGSGCNGTTNGVCTNSICEGSSNGRCYAEVGCGM